MDYLKTETSVSYKDLVRGFENPPDQARLRSLWKWANSLVTKESITRDLEEFRDKGWGGVLINDGGNSSKNNISQNPPWDATGPLYLSPAWKELYQHAVKEADRLGLEITSVMGSGWNPGGPAITPEYAVKKLVYSETEVKGGKQIQISLPKPDTLFMYRDILVQAIRDQRIDSAIKDSAIMNWSLKSFNQSFGAQGNYPLYQLREWENNESKLNVIRKDDIVDITPYMNGNRLNWDAPQGEWLIIRYGWTCKGTKTSTTSKGWGGLSLDHLNPDAFRLFSDSVIIPIVETVQSVGNSVKYLWTDSWEMGVTNWTNNFSDEFKRFRGYELNEYMPVLAGRVVENQEITNRFLHDFRKTVSDCILENHYRLFASLAHQYGLGIHPESGGPHAAPIDAMRVMGVSDYPMGEFWIRANTHRVSDAARFFVQQSACVAHTNGKRLVGGEGPQCIGPKWERAPKDMKHDLDRAFCSGVNRLFWTNSIASPQEFGIPGVVNFAANHLNPNITWWEQTGDFVQYINRCSFILQQGLYVADVLYYYGDDVPNFIFLKEDYPELQYGYNWDKCSKDVILDRASVSKGKIILPDGMSYRVLVLTPEESIDLDVLKKVEQLVREGATVVSPRPLRATGLSNYPFSDEAVKAIAGRMWGAIDGDWITEHAYGKGRVIWGKDINEVLNSMGVSPDFSFRSLNDKTALDYIHRRMDHQEVYFVVNRFAYHEIDDFEYHKMKTPPDRYEEVECSFRVSGKIPELWDPMSGEIKRIAAYREENGQTIIPLHFGPEASCFIVFKESPISEDHIITIEKDGDQIFPMSKKYQVKADPVINLYRKDKKIVVDLFEKGAYVFSWSSGRMTQLNSEYSEEVPIPSPWTVHFDPAWGGPENIIFSDLKSWLEFDDPGIKYYSGKATYVNSFQVQKQDYKGKKVFLDLGKVEELAVVRINGHTFPVAWMPPFKVDITGYLVNGENKLEVDVINQWPNRIIGDSKLPAEKRFAKTNYLKFYQPDSDQYLRESGLIGPVKLQFVNTEELN
ncbi:MAG: glycosyl hydrolase [Mangrovibacterium sp.]